MNGKYVRSLKNRLNENEEIHEKNNNNSNPEDETHSDEIKQNEIITNIIYQNICMKNIISSYIFSIFILIILILLALGCSINTLYKEQTSISQIDALKVKIDQLIKDIENAKNNHKEKNNFFNDQWLSYTQIDEKLSNEIDHIITRLHWDVDSFKEEVEKKFQ